MQKDTDRTGKIFFSHYRQIIVEQIVLLYTRLYLWIESYVQIIALKNLITTTEHNRCERRTIDQLHFWLKSNCQVSN